MFAEAPYAKPDRPNYRNETHRIEPKMLVLVIFEQSHRGHRDGDDNHKSKGAQKQLDANEYKGDPTRNHVHQLSNLKEAFWIRRYA